MTILIFALYTVVMVVNAMKGKWWFAVGSIVIPLVFFAALVGAVRLAKPTSFWARRLYDREQMERSVKRILSEDEYAEFRKRTGAATQGRTAVEVPDGKDMSEYGKIGASKEEIGELAPPIE
ncbi:MAG: hypothetical protein M3Y23_06370 [Actinomycetota bacterium]|nr:hypothetical protein [Actinomycetota bacterium]